MPKHQLRFWRRRGDSPPQKHSRPARLERFALLLVSSPHRLASSAAGGASAVRPTPVPGTVVLHVLKKQKNSAHELCALNGGEGETRTPAPVTRPTPLAGAPRHQLEYFSIGNYI